MVQLSNPHTTTGKTVALTRWTFESKVMSLLFNMLSRFVIAFLPRSKCLLISWLWSTSAVILEPKKIKSLTVFIVSPFICHEVMGPEAMIFIFWMLSFKPGFSLLFHLQEVLYFFAFCFKCGVIYSNWYFLQANLIPACASSSPNEVHRYISHDVLCI